MAVSDKQKEYVRKHQQEKLDEIKVRPQKGTKERWRAAADAEGKSLQQFIIDTMEAAQLMRGKVGELYRDDIDDEVIFAAELIGMEVYCEGELLGKIKDVLDYPGNSVYVVKGHYEYMIPAVKQFILSTDMENNVMQVKIIEGMRSDEN